MSYDPSCEDMARAFLEGEVDDLPADVQTTLIEQYAPKLAQEIADHIDRYIEFDADFQGALKAARQMPAIEITPGPRVVARRKRR